MRIFLKKSTQHRVINKIYTISYDSLVQVNQHLNNNQNNHTEEGSRHGDIVTLLTKSRRVNVPTSAEMPLPSPSSGNHKKNNKGHAARSRSASTPPVFYLHAFRFDSEESALKMEHYLNVFRANYFSRFKPKHASSSSTAAATASVACQSTSSLAPAWDNNLHLRNKNLKRSLFFM